tara:strand:+ start:719 stop:2293 length:1575 start_codon:yes stop_codon:yes gene_type:complete
MAYNSSKGPQQQGDLKFESDPDDTQIDFENDFIALKTNAIQRFIVSGSFITSSVPLSCSLGFSAASVSVAGTTIDATQISSSLNVSASAFYADGELVVTSPIATYSNAGDNRVLTSVNSSAIQAESFLTHDGNILKSIGQISASLGVSGSTGHFRILNASSIVGASPLEISASSITVTGSLTFSGSSTISASAGYFTTVTASSATVSALTASAVSGGSPISIYGDTITMVGGGAGSTIITSAHLSSSLPISGSEFYGDSAHLTTNLVVTGTLQIGTEEPGTNCTSKISSGTDNSAVMIVKSPGHPVLLAVTGSGQVLVGGFYLGAKLNITGSDTDMLLAAKSNSKNPAFYVSGSGELYNSGSVILNTVTPGMELTSSLDSAANATIRLNSANNILIQNNTVNKHIVFKASDAGTVREGLRVDGAVPEVVVNQGSDSLVNFRVESDTNTHTLFVTGSGQVGIGCSDPAVGVALDISGSSMRLRDPMTVPDHGAVGLPGEIRWDTNYIYVCVAIDTWKRVALVGGW